MISSIFCAIEKEESEVCSRLMIYQNNLPEYAKLTYLHSPGQTILTITLSGNSNSELKLKLKKVESDILKIFGPEYFFSTSGESIESVVGKLLKSNHLNVSVAESCTGGAISALITSTPGASSYFHGSAVCYSNSSKIKLLGVNIENIEKFGAVSAEVVEEMAMGSRILFNTDYAISTSGIAGPDGATKAKPVGTVCVGLSSKLRTTSIKYQLGFNRSKNIQVATLYALNFLRLEILRDIKILN